MAKTVAKSANPEAVKLNAMFDAFINETLDRSPEFVTSLGLDKGKRAYQRSMLANRSLAEIAALKQINTSQLARLGTINRSALTGVDAINYDTVLYGLRQQEEADKRFQYGALGTGAPYVLYQLGGAYQSEPDFLDSQHQIANKTDADDYLARLAMLGTVFDQEREVAEHDIALGVIPPDFVLARTIEEMTKLRVAPKKRRSPAIMPDRRPVSSARRFIPRSTGRSRC